MKVGYGMNLHEDREALIRFFVLTHPPLNEHEMNTATAGNK